MYNLILRTCSPSNLRHSIFQLNGALNSFLQYRCLTNITSSSMSDENNPSSSIFEGIVDRYNGVTVDSSEEASTTNEEFSLKLDESLKKWLESERRAIWFKIGIDKSDWVPLLAKKGFKFHHSKDNAVTMYKWISEGEPDGIPSYCHTMVGVGGFVVNDKFQILVVSEKHYTFPHWKLPGGSVDPGEDLVDAVIREVQEETGIKTVFHSLLAIRHAHKRAYDASDLYISFSLKPLTTDITKCDREIKECQWMDFNEYLNHPHVHGMNRLIAQKYLEYKEKNIRIDCETSIHEVLKFPVQTYFVVNE